MLERSKKRCESVISSIYTASYFSSNHEKQMPSVGPSFVTCVTRRVARVFFDSLRHRLAVRYLRKRAGGHFWDEDPQRLAYLDSLPEWINQRKLNFLPVRCCQGKGREVHVCRTIPDTSYLDSKSGGPGLFGHMMKAVSVLTDSPQTSIGVGPREKRNVIGAVLPRGSSSGVVNR